MIFTCCRSRCSRGVSGPAQRAWRSWGRTVSAQNYKTTSSNWCHKCTWNTGLSLRATEILGSYRQTTFDRNSWKLRKLKGCGQEPGLKIIFERWSVVLTGQTNISSVLSLFWPVKILKKLFWRISLLSQKYASYAQICVVKEHKSLNVSLKNACDLHFHRQWAQTAFYSMWNLKCRAASDNNGQTSLYYLLQMLI